MFRSYSTWKSNNATYINLILIAFEKITKKSQKINWLILQSEQRFINEKHSANGTNEKIIQRKEEIKCNNIKNNSKNNLNWPQISDHPYKILTTGGSGTGKTNALLNPIKQQTINSW